MTKQRDKQGRGSEDKEARLKAALKANLARRKQQAKKRQASSAQSDGSVETMKEQGHNNG